nr:immunoglobulin light chain junction region [Macaca mulatta]MOX56560.1 immunoglobulin light chain junction region [Macaca mulatta]
CVQGSHWPTF